MADMLKKFSKVIKNERLLPLLEKKSQPQELLGNLFKIETAYFVVMVEYLFNFAVKHVITTKESGTCLFDCISLQSNTQNHREKIDQVLN